jgi:glycosyltransferase involved in cell wall biosynthesis
VFARGLGDERSSGATDRYAIVLAMPDATPEHPTPVAVTTGRGILIYGMYPLARMDRAPEVRIAMMTEALGRQVHTERIAGGRFGRFRGWLGWLVRGGPRRIGAVYVESSTSSAMPTDLAFFALMRLLRRPVGVYFRDAYQLFRDVHPRTRKRQILTDWLWRVTTPLLKGVASVRYSPSRGLATALKLKRPVLLPPGTDPSLPQLGAGERDVVAAVVQIGPRSGFDTLLAAMELVRKRRPKARLIVGSKATADWLQGMPDWVSVSAVNRDSLPQVLEPARVCVLPLPINAYTNLAVAVRMLDFLGFGKPVVATDTDEARALIAASQAGIATPATPEGLAEGILRVLEDDRLAARMAGAARAYARSPEATWDARAQTVLSTLGISGREPASGLPTD